MAFQARRAGTCPASGLPIAVGDDLVKVGRQWQLTRDTITRKRAYLSMHADQQAWNEHRNRERDQHARDIAADDFDQAQYSGSW